MEEIKDRCSSLSPGERELISYCLLENRQSITIPITNNSVGQLVHKSLIVHGGGRPTGSIFTFPDRSGDMLDRAGTSSCLPIGPRIGTSGSAAPSKLKETGCPPDSRPMPLARDKPDYHLESAKLSEMSGFSPPPAGRTKGFGFGFYRRIGAKAMAGSRSLAAVRPLSPAAA